MKPNFAQMSKAELKAYVRANRDDIEAIRFLFRIPPTVEVKRYPAMYDEHGVPVEEFQLNSTKECYYVSLKIVLKGKGCCGGIYLRVM